MPTRNVKRVYTFISIVVLILITIPYLYAVTQAGDGHHFGGFLLNPIDGYSYLSKMHQGWSGEWKFRLPYTHQSGEGAYLFLFYLTLGHLAKGVGLSRIVVFHLIRVLSAALLLASLARYFQRSLPTDRGRAFSFTLAAIGSGLGWVGVLGGLFTADLWVAETYPFLSAYANPHFPLALAIFFYLLDPGKERSTVGIMVLTLLLSLILPFAVILLIFLRSGDLALDWMMNEERTFQDVITSKSFKLLLILAFSGLPVLMYDFWVVRLDPVLSVWNRQNITPSPPIWNSVLALSPPFLLSIWGIRRAKTHSSGKLWALWLVGGAFLIYLPWNLQRRFLFGYYVPCAGLAFWGLRELRDRIRINMKTLMIVVIFLSLPTNLIILASGFQAINRKDPSLYLTKGEMKAMEWLDNHTGAKDLILASPRSGLFIPAYTGRRVIYGHPFETTYADRKKMFVEDFFSGKMSEGQRAAFLEKNEVDYVYVGPRAVEFEGFQELADLQLVYQCETIKIYQASR